MTELTEFQRRLLNEMQNPLPVVRTPYAAIAERLGAETNEVLQQLREFRDSGLIRRFRPQINYRALGRVAVLVAAPVPADRLEAVAEEISRNPRVSHNYQREHGYNLWFTLQGDSLEGLDAELRELSGRLGVRMTPLPAERVYKLDVRFPLVEETGPVEPSVPSQETVELTAAQKDLLGRMQGEFPLVERPFDTFADERISPDEVVAQVGRLQDLGVIRRIAAVLNYRQLGFTANIMCCFDVPAERADEIARRLVASPMVSHCYIRPRMEGFPYNLYAMVHARDEGQVEALAGELATDSGVEDWQLLSTVREFKKQPVRHAFR